MSIQTAQSAKTSIDPFRHDWQAKEVRALMEQPFNDLLFQAHSVHRAHFDPNVVQLSTLLNIKSGGCPEDCAYCPQSARFDTNVSADPVLPLEQVLLAAARAKAAGATRFCMGAAWRAPKDRELQQVIPLIEGVRAMGLETCVTLGMLNTKQVNTLRDAGLDYYNHNLDTSPEFYGNVISTRTYDDRLNTLTRVRDAGIKVCCGGIVGLGEGTQDRSELLRTLANLPSHPESVPINLLVRVEGTPLANAESVHPFDFVRTIATARILMPASHVRLSAGRTDMTDELQALCFFAGANSIFYGEQLLTTANPDVSKDQQLFARLGLSPTQQHAHS
jgi:biotin synthase